MNSKLQQLLDLIQQSEKLSADDKAALSKSVKEANKEIEITSFKLERTEKVKHTTAILLEETIAELEQKRKSIEAQNHELEIEAALERVRSSALAMKKPDDMLDVCRIITEQLELLNVKEIRNVQTAIFYKERGTYMNYEYYAKHKETFITETTYTNNEIHQAFAQRMLKGNGEFYITHIKGEEVKDWIAYQKTTNVFIDDYLYTASSLNYYWYSLGQVALGISTYEPLKDEETNLFKRFLKVFELAYRRYSDIERATAQARESQIQLALERVRARTMAMQKSDELSETAYVLFQQFNKLGEVPEQISIGIMNEEEHVMDLWATIHGNQVNRLFKISLDEPIVMLKLYSAWKEQKKSFVIDISGKELQQYNDYRNSLSDINIDDERTQHRRVVHAAFFSKGLISFSGEKTRPPESLHLLERFAGVFDQTYTRFLDLQKAEAQAREAQIEAALERVRARTMAMQKSTDLGETSALLFRQLNALVPELWTCGFVLCEKNKTVDEWWLSGGSGFMPDLILPNVGDALHYNIYKAWLNGETYYEEVIQGEALRQHYKWLMMIPSARAAFDAQAAAGIQQPVWQQLSCAYFSRGYLVVITEKPCKEAQIFKRFAAVFEQTYTRFLDLQKAEAQAREAKIEAALEKVRSRSLAVHHSNEFKEVITVVFEKLQELGIAASSVSINIFNEGSKDVEAYICGQNEGELSVLHIRLVYFDHLISNDRYNAQKSGLDFFSKSYSCEEKNSFFKYLFEISDLKYLPDDIKKMVFQSKRYTISMALAKNSIIVVNDFEGNLLSENEIDIVKRFSRVFEQAYVRFLDLQKAEAQAREAQIESALEKVRSRSLAMHKSEELHEVVTVVFERMKELHIAMDAVNINIFYKGTRDVDLWVASPGQDYAACFHLPYIDLAIPSDIFNAREKDKDFFAKAYSFEEKNKYFNYLFTHSDFKHLPDNRKNKMLAGDAYAVSLAFTKNAAISIHSYSGKLFSTDENDILKRFAKVFEQAYIRFLDLQKAEEQSRENQIQLALERARTQSMIMQHSNELDDTLRVFHEQVLSLGINSSFSFLWLPDEDKDRHIFWAAWAENNSFKSKAIDYPLDRNEPATSQCLIDWKGNEPVVSYHVASDGVENYFAAWSELIAGVEQLKPQYFSNGLYYVEAFMKYGCFGVMVKSELSEDEKKILARFATEFERAYTRFLDLQKAEAQAREAQIEAALERVRSRSMGMQKSEELKEVIQVVYEQFVYLNIHVEHTGFIIDYKERDDMLIWLADKQAVPFQVTIPYFDCAHWNSFNEAKAKGENFFSNHLSFEEKNKFYEDLFKLFSVPDEAKDYYFSAAGLAISTVLLDDVGLYIENFEGTPYSDEDNKVLMRFGKVFQQTYTRFNDLKQAEAQSRESQIELSLERLRAKTMAMHNSADVGETAAVMVEELKKLEIETIRCGIGIMHEPGDMEVWTIRTNENGKTDIIIGWLDMKMHPLLHGAFESWRNKNDSYSYELKDEDLLNYYNAINNYPGYPIHYNTSNLPKQIHHNEFHFSEGTLFAFSLQQLTNEQRKIFKRFAGVFGQTYRRYLDLKKAEAQAKEAQIEAALERVRSEAMAMHSSDGLLAVTLVLREQMAVLEQKQLESILIHIYDEENDTFEAWFSYRYPGDTADKIVNGRSHLEWSKTARAKKDKEKYYSKETDYTITADYAMLKEWYEYLEINVPEVVEHDENGNILVPDVLYYNYSKFSGGTLLLITSNEASADSKYLLKRSAEVFNLAYRRYLDLKKAEAQAKEAKIEAALERVRSRTLAMQKSDELAETSAVLFRQLISLGIKPNRLYISIMKDDDGETEFWITDEDGSKVSMAYEDNLNNNPSFKKMFDGWKQQKKSLVIDMKGKDLKNYLNYLSSIHVPFKGGLEQKRRLQYIAYFSEGFIGMASPDEQPAETLQLLERFAYVFNLTFTRFNDLQIAEAHALQAEHDLIEIIAARKKAEETLAELQSTQKQLVQSEKMASLGELTAGIAHEIQNPLNFVNNFSEVSKELLDEMKAALESGDEDEAKEIVKDVIQNLEKINHHGKRADAIVKGMLQHSRKNTGIKEPTDINALCDEYLRLAYHGLRAKDKNFNADYKTDFDDTIEKINIVPQDIGRVLLNLINNAFYAVNEKKKSADETYQPTVSVSTKKDGNKIFISVKDNGNGIPQNIVDKIFQPFFTTKPTGSGTGLGLSLSYDIIKAHGGEIKVESKGRKGSEFVIQLPLNNAS